MTTHGMVVLVVLKKWGPKNCIITVKVVMKRQVHFLCEVEAAAAAGHKRNVYIQGNYGTFKAVVFYYFTFFVRNSLP